MSYLYIKGFCNEPYRDYRFCNVSRYFFTEGGLKVNHNYGNSYLKNTVCHYGESWRNRGDEAILILNIPGQGSILCMGSITGLPRFARNNMLKKTYPRFWRGYGQRLNYFLFFFFTVFCAGFTGNVSSCAGEPAMFSSTTSSTSSISSRTLYSCFL